MTRRSAAHRSQVSRPSVQAGVIRNARARRPHLPFAAALLLLAAAATQASAQVVVASPATVPAAEPEKTPPPDATPQISDAERSAINITAYDLDARLMPRTAGLLMRARLTLRNDGAEPLTHLALQISSSLRWTGATLVDGTRRQPLTLAQHLLETDTDHTGREQELVLSLPAPLAPGASLQLDTFYGGTITANADRLMRIGATAEAALAADWDRLGPERTGMRGFGNVLWYPVASPQLFLGDGATLFNGIGSMEARERSASMALRLAVETLGDQPAAAYFCGRRQPLKPVTGDTAEAADTPAALAPGLVTAEFPAAPLGFRTPSLFLLPQTETLLAPFSTTGTDLLATEGADDLTGQSLATAAEHVAPLLSEWLGAQPLTALTLINNPGQPFEDGPLVVAPLATLSRDAPEPALVHGLSHAWLLTGQPWIDEGVAMFLTLKWTERTAGRTAALAQLADLTQPLALAEPALADPNADPATKPAAHRSAAAVPGTLAPGTEGQSLPDAYTELYYRRKAAAVFWMLDDLLGDAAVEQAFAALRSPSPPDTTPAAAALHLEALLEKTSGKDLKLFFSDWVLHDRGLPDLAIGDVSASVLPAAPGRSTGWLVAVTVRNDGGAVAEVPLTVSAGSFQKTERIAVPAFSSLTTRVVSEAEPTEVVVNDGSVPEVANTLHRRAIVVHTK